MRRITFPNPRHTLKPQVSEFIYEDVPDSIPSTAPHEHLGNLVLQSWRLLDINSTDQDLKDFLYMESNFDDLPVENVEFNYIAIDSSFFVKGFFGTEPKPEDVNNLIVVKIDKNQLLSILLDVKRDYSETAMSKIGFFVLNGLQNVYTAKMFDPNNRANSFVCSSKQILFDFLLEEFFTRNNTDYVPEPDPKIRAIYYISLAAHYVAKKVLLGGPEASLDKIAPLFGLPVKSYNGLWFAYLPYEKCLLN